MKTTPYWWEAAEPAHGERQFPKTTWSVLIIGAGYTGLSAAITLAEAGVSDVLVVDALRIGEGASSRNGGQIGNGAKFSLSEAEARFGAQRGREILDDYAQSMNFMLQRAETLGADIDLNRSGAVTGIHSAADLEKLRGMLRDMPPETRKNFQIITGPEAKKVLKTDIYQGVMLRHGQGTLHPAKYVRALADRARALGVSIVTGWRYEGHRAGASGHEARLLPVTGGQAVDLQVGKILYGMNGYVQPQFKFLRQRTIPVASYMIATEEMPYDLLEELIPHNRAVGDTKKVLYYYRRSPDGRRILFGGRARFSTSTEVQSAAGLRAFMEETFPVTKGVGITHSWQGNVCFAYDFCSHAGRAADGVYYASCCNGGGISNQTYMGHRVAQFMLGEAGSERGVVGSPFPKIWFYGGNPWFLPLVGTFYRWQDRRAI